MQLGIRTTLFVGLASLLLVAGTVATLVGARLVGGEAEAQVLAEQRRSAGALARLAAATCDAAGPCRDAFAGAAPGAAVVVFDAALRPLAGAQQGAPAPVVADALQGGALAWRVVQRPLEAGPGARDHQVAVPWRAPDGRGGVVLAVFPLDALVTAVAARQRLVVAYLLLDFAAVLLFGLYLAGRLVVRPIRRLTDAAAQGAEARIPLLEGPRELARLSRAFADMVDRLRAQNERLTASLAALESARDELVRAEKLATVGRLAAGVAHEVGNPLAAVQGYVEFLRDPRGCPPEQQQDLLARVDRELQRIGGTLRELLDFSRPAPTQRAPLDVAEVVASATELVRYDPRFRKIAIDVAGEAPAALGDAARLRQVLVNLLFNAADALGGEGRVVITSSVDDDGRPRLDVRDDGPGVPLGEVGSLFEPFHTTKPVGQGTGLGLAICQRLLEEAGGAIALTSPPGGPGACFTVWLPAAPTADA